MRSRFIPRGKFREAFERLNWIFSEASSGRYDIWTSPNDKDFWTIVPKDETGSEYLHYQLKNIKVLAMILGLDETEVNIEEISDQVVRPSYKLINRIQNKKAYSGETVPFELAQTLSSKNIGAFRTFYNLKTKGKQGIPLENFELNHTQQGSFVIPVSIFEPQSNQVTMLTLPSPINTILRDYLSVIEKLTQISVKASDAALDKIIDERIDSKIFKDFCSEADGIAAFQQKYKERIDQISISSKSSPFLDFNLSDEMKTFQEVELDSMPIASAEFISALEKREVESDGTVIKEVGATIRAEVDSVDKNGTAKFSVLQINGEEVKEAFKAKSTQLTQKTLNLLADAFKTRDSIEIVGDIKKLRGRVGEIIGDEYKTEEKPPTLFG